jgi:hypothetical protein
MTGTTGVVGAGATVAGSGSRGDGRSTAGGSGDAGSVRAGADGVSVRAAALTGSFLDVAGRSGAAEGRETVRARFGVTASTAGAGATTASVSATA